MAKKSPNPTDKHVANRIRLRRLQLGMTQEDLARILGITFQQVQKYEKGVNRVSAGRLQAIALALAVPLHFFYEDVPDAVEPAVREDALRLGQIMASPEIVSLVQAVARVNSPKISRILRDLAEAIAEEIEINRCPPGQSQTSINPR